MAVFDILIVAIVGLLAATQFWMALSHGAVAARVDRVKMLSNSYIFASGEGPSRRSLWLSYWVACGLLSGAFVRLSSQTVEWVVGLTIVLIFAGFFAITVGRKLKGGARPDDNSLFSTPAVMAYALSFWAVWLLYEGVGRLWLVSLAVMLYLWVMLWRHVGRGDKAVTDLPRAHSQGDRQAAA